MGQGWRDSAITGSQSFPTAWKLNLTFVFKIRNYATHVSRLESLPLMIQDLKLHFSPFGENMCH